MQYLKLYLAMFEVRLKCSEQGKLRVTTHSLNFPSLLFQAQTSLVPRLLWTTWVRG